MILITGFPRSGTTYALQLLRNQNRCFGGVEEQGLPWFWHAHKSFPNHHAVECAHRDKHPTVRMAGFYVTQAMVSQGAAVVIDQLATAQAFRTNEFLVRKYPLEFLVSKCPLEFWPQGWPSEYVNESSVFDDFRMIVMRRDFWPMMHSRHEHFPHLAGEDVFPVWERYNRFYERLPADPRVRMFQYEIFGEAIKSGELAEFLGLDHIEVGVPFVCQNDKYEVAP